MNDEKAVKIDKESIQIKKPACPSTFQQPSPSRILTKRIQRQINQVETMYREKMAMKILLMVIYQKTKLCKYKSSYF